jgi:hypothetical protein
LSILRKNCCEPAAVFQASRRSAATTRWRNSDLAK